MHRCSPPGLGVLAREISLSANKGLDEVIRLIHILVIIPIGRSWARLHLRKALRAGFYGSA